MGEVSMMGRCVSIGRSGLTSVLLLATAGASAAAEGDTRVADAAMRRDLTRERPASSVFRRVMI
jgi:hypothetical protein